MAQRRFASSGTRVLSAGEDGGGVVHLKKGVAEPTHFALVKPGRTDFVKTRFGQVVVFTSREDANEACRQKGWPGNIGMGEQKWTLFKRDYVYVLNPSFAQIPKANQLRMVVLPFFGVLVVSACLFFVFKSTRLFDDLAKLIGVISGLKESRERSHSDSKFGS